jgi:hypothetical protein
MGREKLSNAAGQRDPSAANFVVRGASLPNAGELSTQIRIARGGQCGRRGWFHWTYLGQMDLCGRSQEECSR